MANPTLVIGIGGTGTYVLTHLKRKLLEIHRDIPGHIRLLAIDTDAENRQKRDPDAAAATQAGIPTRQVRLTPEIEIVTFGDTLFDLSNAIQDNRFPEISWFSAGHFLNHFPAQMFNTRQGSGRIRQFGRLALFKDLLTPVRSVVYNHIRVNFDDLAHLAGNAEPIDIVITGSMAGGTGGGTFIDIAMIIQNLMAHHAYGMIRGVFLLPDPYMESSAETEEAMTRGYAVWREFDRFMTTGIRNTTSYKLPGILEGSIFPVNPHHPYDVIYLVDPAVRRGALEIYHAAMADFIQATSGEQSRKYYEIQINQSALYRAQMPERGVYSSFGIYTISSSYRKKLEIAAHYLGGKVGWTILAPLLSVRLERAPRHENREEPAEIQEVAGLFFTQPYQYAVEQQVRNTDFLGMLGQLGRKKSDPGWNPEQEFLPPVQSNIRSQDQLHIAFTSILNDPQYQGMDRQIVEIHERIFQKLLEVKRNKLPPASKFEFLMGFAKRESENLFGLDSIPGRSTGGNIEEGYINVKGYQVERFQALANVWLMRTLNGQYTEPLAAKGGKIYYAYLFYSELIKKFNDLTDTLVKMQNRLIERGDEALATQKLHQVEEKFRHLKDKRSIFFFWRGFTSPKVEEAEKEYLEALGELWFIQIHKVLLKVSIATLQEIATCVSKKKERLFDWIVALKSVSTALSENRKSLEREYEEARSLHPWSEILPGPEIDVERSVPRILASLNWEIDAEEAVLVMKNGEKKEWSINLQEPQAVEKLLGNILAEARQECSQERPAITVAEEIIQHYPDPRQFARMLNDKVNILYRPSPIPSFGFPYYLIYVMNDINQDTLAYFYDVEDELKKIQGRINTVNVVPVQDPGSLTIVRFDEVIPGEGFATYRDCRDVYIQMLLQNPNGIQKAPLYHNYTGEMNALGLETRLALEMRQAIRLLCPQVVNLLENLPAFSLFLKAILFGCLRVEEERIYYHPEGLQERTELVLDGRDKSALDLFEIIAGFTSGAYRFIDYPRLDGRVNKALRQVEGSDRPVERSENLWAYLHLIMKRTSDRFAPTQWSDLLNVTVLLYIQIAELSRWQPLARLIRSIHSEGARGIEKLRERLQVSHFFEKAGFEVNPGEEAAHWFTCQPRAGLWKAKMGDSVVVYLYRGKTLERSSVQLIYEQFAGDKNKYKCFIIVVDQAIKDSGWLEIATLRAEGFRIVPLDDSVIKIGQESRSEMLELDKALSRFFEEDQDLYSIQHPISDRLNFFGREAIAAKLIKQMELGKPTGVFGLRKIGKSSLLYYIRNQAPFPVAYIDLQKSLDLPDIYDRILTSWMQALRVLHPDFRWDSPPLQNRTEPGPEFAQRSTELSHTLQRSNLPTRLGLIIDEIELIVPDDRPESLARYLSFSRTIRGLVQEDGFLSILVAGVSTAINSINRLGDQQSPFYQFFDVIYLGPLSREDTIQMVRNIGQQMGVSIDKDAADTIASASGGHPFLARKLCSLAIQSFPEIRKIGAISADHMLKAMQDFIQNPDYAGILDQQGMWGEITNANLWSPPEIKEHEAILETLASDQPCTLTDRLSATVDPAIRDKALHNLSSRSVIRDHKQQISIQFALFRNWIRKYRLRGNDTQASDLGRKG
jgi:hypothetical protein